MKEHFPSTSGAGRGEAGSVSPVADGPNCNHAISPRGVTNGPLGQKPVPWKETPAERAAAAGNELIAVQRLRLER